MITLHGRRIRSAVQHSVVVFVIVMAVACGNNAASTGGSLDATDAARQCFYRDWDITESGGRLVSGPGARLAVLAGKELADLSFAIRPKDVTPADQANGISKRSLVQVTYIERPESGEGAWFDRDWTYDIVFINGIAYSDDANGLWRCDGMDKEIAAQQIADLTSGVSMEFLEHELIRQPNALYGELATVTNVMRLTNHDDVPHELCVYAVAKVHHEPPSNNDKAWASWDNVQCGISVNASSSLDLPVSVAGSSSFAKDKTLYLYQQCVQVTSIDGEGIRTLTNTTSESPIEWRENPERSCASSSLVY